MTARRSPLHGLLATALLLAISAPVLAEAPPYCGTPDLPSPGSAQRRASARGRAAGPAGEQPSVFVQDNVVVMEDLDGTLFIARDRSPAMIFENGKVSYPDGGWGSPA